MKIDQDFFGLRDAGNLLAHLREGEPFRAHVQERLRLVVPALAIYALVAAACAAALRRIPHWPCGRAPFGPPGVPFVRRPRRAAAWSGRSGTSAVS